MWMGHERKRGKLEDLNGLLRGRAHDAFALVVGETGVLPSVRYVITLDTDTQLPRDSARQLVEAMAHPLNRAHYDPQQQRVTEGYGILQPRVAASLPELSGSKYSRLWGGEPGIDPYTRAVSDVYQDLFGEGSFIGKGIYDVDAFEQALAGRLPENRILSHDLLEGSYARAGLLSDVQLYEPYPARYSADAARRHRWTRGDWQIARWALRTVPHPHNGTQRNALTPLSRWKILDNLRRSVTPAALIGLLWLTWIAMSPAWAWTLVVIGLILIAPATASLIELFRRPDDVTVRQHLAGTAHSAARHGAQAAFTLACLPYEAYYSVDAIVRSTARMLMKRRLLEWTTASEAEANSSTRLSGIYLTMWSAPATAIAAAIFLAAVRPEALGVAAPVLLLWFAAPAIAWWVSRPRAAGKRVLSADDVVFLRKTSRRTWAFFEDFVAAGDHHLPPDNYQEHPAQVVAHRTSPTNIGMSLLANLSAYDFGYVPAAQLIERTRCAFQTLQNLERYQGHFYNWYDTQTLKPLTPLYVSSVDSGNLSGYLMVLRSGLLALAGDKILHPQLFAGLRDTLRVLLEGASVISAERFASAERHLESLEKMNPPALPAAYKELELLVRSLSHAAESLDPADDPQTRQWADAALRQARAALEDLLFLAPWLALPRVPADLSELLSSMGIPTLHELAAIDREWLPAIANRQPAQGAAAQAEWLESLSASVVEGSQRARGRIAVLERLAAQADELGSSRI